MTLKGTKTANNLMHAFAGESQARNRYTYYASIAKKEGFVQIQNIFLETPLRHILPQAFCSSPLFVFVLLECPFVLLNIFDNLALPF